VTKPVIFIFSFFEAGVLAGEFFNTDDAV